MAQLQGLIRYKRHDLDEKRQALAKLNTELENLRANKKRLLDKLQHEKNLAAVDVDVARNFGAYMNRMLTECGALDMAIEQKLQDIQAATHLVQESYLEVKKLEVTQDARDRAQEDRLSKLESNTLDEIAIDGFRRKQTTDSLT